MAEARRCTLETTAVGKTRRLIGSCGGAARGGRSAVAAPTGRRVALFWPRLSACVFPYVNSGMTEK